MIYLKLNVFYVYFSLFDFHSQPRPSKAASLSLIVNVDCDIQLLPYVLTRWSSNPSTGCHGTKKAGLSLFPILATPAPTLI